MTTAALYVTLSVALYYLASRAKITEGIWSRYPTWLNEWTLCSACSGFWYGFVLAIAIGAPLNLPLLGMPAGAAYTPIVAGLLTMVWTPILARAMVVGWMDLMQTDEGDETEGP